MVVDLIYFSTFTSLFCSYSGGFLLWLYRIVGDFVTFLD